MKLLIRGGSIAAGVGVATSYVDILREKYAPLGVDLINRSRSRETTFQGIWSFEEDIAPARPEILLIHFGLDDAFHPVYRSEMKENLVRMVNQAREGFDPIIMLATSHTFENPYDMDAVNIYYRTIREVCIDLGCEMIPVHTYWAGYLWENKLNVSDLVLSDDRLPNEDGHRVIAAAMTQHLDRILCPDS